MGIPTCQNCGTEHTTHFVFWVSLGKGENMTGSKEQRLYGILQSILSGTKQGPLNPERACACVSTQYYTIISGFSVQPPLKEIHLFFLEMLLAPTRKVLC